MNRRRHLVAIATQALAPALAAALLATATPSHGEQAMNTPSASIEQHESQVARFKPRQGLAATNGNDVRRFVYEWFTHFEHASAKDYYLGHLDDGRMSLAFPGAPALASHADFARWYDNLLAQTLWNFHDVSALRVAQVSAQEFLVSFVVDWYGEVRPDSDQLAGWQSRKDSRLYHHKLRQTWTVKAGERLVIERLVVSAGDTPSPIPD